MLITFFAGSTQAARCDYCSTEGTWDCRPSYVGYPDTNEYFFAGSVCTFFYAVPDASPVPGAEYADIWDVIMNRFRYLAQVRIPNNSGTTADKPATCTSDVGARFDHAHEDVARYIVTQIANKGPVPSSGARVVVEYDDGGTEFWRVVDPYSTAAKIYTVPEQGTLKCPTTYQ